MLRPTFNWLSMLRRLWPRLKISGARHKVHSERERHTLIPDPCRLGILPDKVSLTLWRQGDIEIFQSSVTRSSPQNVCLSRLWYSCLRQRRARWRKTGVPNSNHWHSNNKVRFYPGEPDLGLWCQRRGTVWQETQPARSKWLKSPRTLKRATQKGALVSKNGHSMTRDPPYSRWLKSPRSLIRTRKKKGESRWC